jgi:uncharacterized protein YaeQ
MLTATIYNFDIDLADHDRGVYESLAVRAARHPSESGEYLWTRVLAYALEFTDGIAFSRGGVSDPDEPPVSVRDLTGAYRSWIEIGWPDADRLHKAAKVSPRVAVYVHKDPAQWLARIAAARIHRSDAIDVFALDRGFVQELTARLERRIAFALSVSERELTAAIGADVLTGTLARLRLE